MDFITREYPLTKPNRTELENTHFTDISTKVHQSHPPFYARTDANLSPDRDDKKSKLDLLKESFDDESDPQAKLNKWKEYHLELVKTKTDSMKDNPLKKDIKNKIKDSSKKEVQDEIEQLSKKKDLSTDDIKNLDERKGIELSLEVTHNINISEDIDSRVSGDAHSGRWSIEQLRQLRKTLSALPANDVKNNPRLLEILRAGKNHPSFEEKTAAFYSPGHDNMVVFDEKPALEKDALEHNIAHEIGHSVYYKFQDTKEGREIIARYEALIGWKNLDNKKAMGTDISSSQGGNSSDEQTDAAAQKLEAIRKKSFGTRDEEQNRVIINGQRYMVNPYVPGGYISAPADNLPEANEYTYGRSSPVEYFAEHYANNFFQKENLTACQDLAKTLKFRVENWKNLTNQEKQDMLKQRERLLRQQELIDKQQKIMKSEILSDSNEKLNQSNPLALYAV